VSNNYIIHFHKPKTLYSTLTGTSSLELSFLLLPAEPLAELDADDVFLSDFLLAAFEVLL